MKKNTSRFLPALAIMFWMLTATVLPAVAQMLRQYPSLPADLFSNRIYVSGWIDARHYTVIEHDRRYSEAVKDGSRMEIPAASQGAHQNRGMQAYKADLKGPCTNPTPSPDGKWIAFTRNNDLYTFNTQTRVETKLTTDGSPVVMNGYASWVYYEEIFGRPSQYRAFWWSPDSKKLCFFHFDDTNVPVFPIYVAKGQHGYLENNTYPKAGDPNPQVKVGFVAPDGSSQTVWADFDEKEDQYFGTPFWRPDSQALWLQYMNRDQTDYVLYAVDPATGAKTALYTEHQDSWIDWIESPLFADNGMFMVRDRGAWQQIWQLPLDGSEARCLTEGENWTVRLYEYLEKSRKLIFSAKRETGHTRSALYALHVPKHKAGRKPGLGKIEALCPQGYHYTAFRIAPDGTHFLARYSNATSPYRVGLFDMKGNLVRMVAETEGPAFAQAQKNGSLPRAEMMYITTPDGYLLPGKIIYPSHFDASRKYPVICHVYGGPDSPTVYDSYPLQRADYYWWATHGVIVVEFDNRACGCCGKEGLNFIHRCLGKWEFHDFKLWAEALRKFAFVNPLKIGITGYSFGGFMTALCVTRAGDLFPYGIAGAGVYDWSLYDSHYTERYMDTPQENPDGYADWSVASHCRQYGRFGNPSLLLLTHGTSDDNVHLQHTYQLIDSLMNHRQHFEFMMYPGERHGYRGAKRVFSDGEDILFWNKTLLSE